MRGALVALALLAAAEVTSCRPDFGERESRVDRRRVLAVRVDPPEAKPGEAVTATLLVGSPAGTVDVLASRWAFCATPKLLTENGAVSAACLEDGVLPIGSRGATVTAALPASSCSNFGPETRSAEVRPRDPDVTGGFFAPLRAQIPGESEGAKPLTAFGFARIQCNLANASADLSSQFQMHYVKNKAPTLLALEARSAAGVVLPFDAIPRGTAVTLRASWRPEDAEMYAVYDIREQTIVTRRESLRVSWFSTAGTFDRDRTGRGAEESETWTDNRWEAPEDAGNAHLWVVLRDARGALVFQDVAVVTR